MIIFHLLNIIEKIFLENKKGKNILKMEYVTHVLPNEEELDSKFKRQ